MPVTSVFDPARDGWFFSNWGETAPYCIGDCNFSWDLYQQAYLGINPNHDYVEAPLDCAFYEIFKGCAAKGNCGGMSLLALALFKYGGYMGFCSPANFYTGTTSPDRADLHQTINVLQARQFSATGIQNFIDTVGAGQLNNADAAYNKIKTQLGNGDYAVIWLANSLVGESAHTLIPYAYDDSPAGFPAGTKILHLWDSDLPYNQYPDYYNTHQNLLVIHSAFDWEYNQGAGTGATGCVDYKGSNNGWCMAVPMSTVLHKARQPMTLDMAFDALTTLFMHGPGAAITQIEDDQGHRFYSADADEHLRWDEIESSPLHGMPWVLRWPWPALTREGQVPGELYFLRRPPGPGSLTLTLRGSNYSLVHAQAGNLVQVQASGAARARDTLTISGLASTSQALELHTSASRRGYTLQQLRSFARVGGWRAIHVINARLNASGLHVQTLGELQVLEVAGLDRPVTYEVELHQYRQKALAKRKVGRHSTTAGRAMQYAPHDWEHLEHTRIDKKSFEHEARGQDKTGP
jgi:hypothetical protein